MSGICQTTDFGYPCRGQATHEVSGMFVDRHVCCALHATMWNMLRCCMSVDVAKIGERKTEKEARP